MGKTFATGRHLLLLTALPLAGIYLALAPANAQTRYNFSAAIPETPAYNSTYEGKRIQAYHGPHEPGTIVVRTSERKLYYVLPDGRAMVYGIGVGRQGFTWKGRHRVTRKAEWPDWRPPAAMRKRQPGLPVHMPGGPNNPLGARALYIGNTLYRIHGTSQPSTIGRAVSSGCIRMLNEEVIDLYNRVQVGTRVVVE